MNDAAVADEPEVIEPDLVEQVDTDETEDVEVTEGKESEETGEAEESAEPSESSAEKETDGFQERINEVTGKFRSEERARIEAETRLKQLEQRLQTMETAEPVDPDKSLVDFDYDEKAYAEHLTKVAKQSAQQEVRERLEQEKATDRQAQFAGREAEFAREVDDYNMKTRNPDLTITESMVETLRTADKGPAVLYYLANNPDEARSLSQMHPLDAAYELGNIGATKLVKPEKPSTQTPPPPPKIKGGDKPAPIRSDSPESDKLSDAEWLRRERKRLAAKDK